MTSPTFSFTVRTGRLTVSDGTRLLACDRFLAHRADHLATICRVFGLSAADADRLATIACDLDCGPGLDVCETRVQETTAGAAGPVGRSASSLG